MIKSGINEKLQKKDFWQGKAIGGKKAKEKQSEADEKNKYIC